MSVPLRRRQSVTRARWVKVAILTSREVADGCGASVKYRLSHEYARQAFLDSYGDRKLPEDV